MKFLLDANIPYSTKEIFSIEHEVFHVRDVELERSADEDIIGWAVKNHAALITRDLDFANILNFPPNKYSGIIVLRLPYFYSAKDIKDALFKFINTVNLDDISKSIIIVEEGRFRIRKQEK